MPPNKTLHEETHLKVLRLVQATPTIQQREMAKTLGISLGKTNFCVNALIDKGLVKMENFRNNQNKLSYAYSVLQMVRAFEQASGRPVPYRVMARRAGDIAACYADASLALALLGWRAERDLAAMCLDAWRWQSNNPNGMAHGMDAGSGPA